MKAKRCGKLQNAIKIIYRYDSIVQVAAMADVREENKTKRINRCIITMNQVWQVLFSPCLSYTLTVPPHRHEECSQNADGIDSLRLKTLSGTDRKKQPFNLREENKKKKSPESQLIIQNIFG